MSDLGSLNLFNLQFCALQPALENRLSGRLGLSNSIIPILSGSRPWRGRGTADGPCWRLSRLIFSKFRCKKSNAEINQKQFRKNWIWKMIEIKNDNPSFMLRLLQKHTWHESKWHVQTFSMSMTRTVCMKMHDSYYPIHIIYLGCYEILDQLRCYYVTYNYLWETYFSSSSSLFSTPIIRPSENKWVICMNHIGKS